jgi:hypothetical protein
LDRKGDVTGDSVREGPDASAAPGSPSKEEAMAKWLEEIERKKAALAAERRGAVENPPKTEDSAAVTEAAAKSAWLAKNSRGRTAMAEQAKQDLFTP